MERRIGYFPTINTDPEKVRQWAGLFWGADTVASFPASRSIDFERILWDVRDDGGDNISTAMFKHLASVVRPNSIGRIVDTEYEYENVPGAVAHFQTVVRFATLTEMILSSYKEDRPCNAVKFGLGAQEIQGVSLPFVSVALLYVETRLDDEATTYAQLLDLTELDTGAEGYQTASQSGAALRAKSVVKEFIEYFNRNSKRLIPSVEFRTCKLGGVGVVSERRRLFSAGDTIYKTSIRTIGNPADFVDSPPPFVPLSPLEMTSEQWVSSNVAALTSTGVSLYECLTDHPPATEGPTGVSVLSAADLIASTPEESEAARGFFEVVTAGGECLRMVSEPGPIQVSLGDPMRTPEPGGAPPSMTDGGLTDPAVSSLSDEDRVCLSDALAAFHEEVTKAVSDPPKETAPKSPRSKRVKRVTTTSEIVGASADLARKLIRRAVKPHPISGDVENVLLVGHTGTGKTSLIEELAKEHGRPFVRLNLNGQTGVDEFVGRWTLQDGCTVWIDGVLPLAMREGHWLLIDEVNAALPEVNMVLQSVLDHARQLRLAEKDGEVIQAHEHFRCFAAMNPSEHYVGTKDLNPALASRFSVTIEIDYPTKKLEAEVLVNRSGVNYEQAIAMTEFAALVRAGFEKSHCLAPIGTRDLLAWGRMISRSVAEGEAPKKAFEQGFNSALAIRSGEDRKFLKDCLQQAAASFYGIIEEIEREDELPPGSLKVLLREYTKSASDLSVGRAAAEQAIAEATERAATIFADAFKQRDEATAELEQAKLLMSDLRGSIEEMKADIAEHVVRGLGATIDNTIKTKGLTHAVEPDTTVTAHVENGVAV